MYSEDGINEVYNKEIGKCIERYSSCLQKGRKNKLMVSIQTKQFERIMFKYGNSHHYLYVDKFQETAYLVGRIINPSF